MEQKLNEERTFCTRFEQTHMNNLQRESKVNEFKNNCQTYYLSHHSPQLKDSQAYESISLLTLQAEYVCHQQPRLEAQNPVNIPEFCQALLAEREKTQKISVVQVSTLLLLVLTLTQSDRLRSNTFWAHKLILVQSSALKGRKDVAFAKMPNLHDERNVLVCLIFLFQTHISAKQIDSH